MTRRQSRKRNTKSTQTNRHRNADSFSAKKTVSYKWVKPLAADVRTHSKVLSTFLAEVLSGVANRTQKEAEESRLLSHSRFYLIQDLARMLVPEAHDVFTSIETSFLSVEHALFELSTDILQDI